MRLQSTLQCSSSLPIDRPAVKKNTSSPLEYILSSTRLRPGTRSPTPMKLEGGRKPSSWTSSGFVLTRTRK